MLTFNKKYALLALLLFIIEVGIAIFIKDRFIRPFLGDVLAVIFLYFLAKTFLKATNFMIGLLVLLFAYTLEVLQYFNLVDLLGLGKYKLATIVLGSTFDWLDLVAYTIGVVMVVSIENKIQERKELEG